MYRGLREANCENPSICLEDRHSAPYPNRTRECIDPVKVILQTKWWVLRSLMGQITSRYVITRFVMAPFIGINDVWKTKVSEFGHHFSSSIETISEQRWLVTWPFPQLHLSRVQQLNYLVPILDCLWKRVSSYENIIHINVLFQYPRGIVKLSSSIFREST